MKKVFILMFLIFLLANVGAKIAISEPKEIYNLGDKIYMDVLLTPNQVKGNFEINLICSNKTINIVRMPAEPSFEVNEEQQYNTYDLLDKDLLSNTTGECRLEATIGSERAETNNFLITDNIDLSVQLDQQDYNPGEVITLTIEAIKANGQPLNGFIEISNATAISKAIESGETIEKFAMPETTEAGEYNLHIKVYDKQDGKILNHASLTKSFRINQVASFIETSLSKLEVAPGESLDIGATLYDQSGKEMQGNIAISLVSSNNEISFSINSGEIHTIDFSNNATPGNWKVYSSFDEILQETEFSIKAVPKAEFEFIENSSILVIKSVGNAPYNKSVNINIGGNISRELKLDILPGEERKFLLEAPDGEYDVKVSDGDSLLEKSLLLTGNAVNVKEAGLSSRNYGFIWIFLVILLAGGGVVLFFKFKGSKKLKFKMPSRKNKEEKFENVKKEEGNAQQSLVLKGEKAHSCVLLINIKNPNELNENSKQTLEGLKEIVKKGKGVANIKEDEIIVIFSPLITKTFKNEILAVRTGEEVKKILEEHNKKFNNPIKFSLAVNSGDLIASKEDKKLKYTAIGNTITLARKMAEGEGLLISDSVRKQMMRAVKVEKKGMIGKQAYYQVVKITDTEANQEKLKEILKRMKQEDNK
ncbi:MAG: hypothetical protein ACP5D2_01340 [Candidatus Nanoarchaeia archaeon]